jgi:hypothetical protein
MILTMPYHNVIRIDEARQIEVPNSIEQSPTLVVEKLTRNMMESCIIGCGIYHKSEVRKYALDSQAHVSFLQGESAWSELTALAPSNCLFQRTRRMPHTFFEQA